VIRAWGVSVAGLVRHHNEDRFVSDEEARLFAVADGMGGHRAGEVASHLAIEAVTAFIRRSATDPELAWPYGIDASLSFDGNRLRTAIHVANHRIFQAAENRYDYNGMGTTIVSLLVNDSNVAIGHVGDSRLYLLSRGSLEQLTQDDSWVATVLAHDPGVSAEQISRHPMRNVLTSVLGAREQVNVHVTERPLGTDDVLLLSSDGLHGVVDAGTIQGILAGTPDVQDAAQRLVDTALEHKSRDNVTALVVRCGSHA
jgi:serine/threonine protein phosphatase PrpC